MRELKHLPVNRWPQADREAFRTAYEPGDVFDETAGPGAHLSEGTRKMIQVGYRRWLGFLNTIYPADFSLLPVERIKPERVRNFIAQLSTESKPITVALVVHLLHAAAKLIDPTTDWAWMKAIKSRLGYRAWAEDRFDRLVPPVQTLNFGIELMDTALRLLTSNKKQREIQYRDGLLLALLSLWPIRRRSVATLTVSRHLELDDAGVNILLHQSNTKAKRPESFRVPEQIVPYLMHYLKEIRPTLLGTSCHDGLWASHRGISLTAGRIYDIVRARVAAKLGKAMSLHDFRRAAATFLAMDAPEKIGLIPGVLQHASPDVGEQHYNLWRSVQSGRRFTAHLGNARNRLRPLATRSAIAPAESTTDSRPKCIDRPSRDDAPTARDTMQNRDRGESSCA
jgi:integrase